MREEPGTLALLPWCRHVLRPLEQRPEKHHRRLLKELQTLATTRWQDRLVVLMPPGSAKSTYAILNMLLGTLATMASAVVSYWVGSSAGSARKNDMLFHSTPNTGGAKSGTG